MICPLVFAIVLLPQDKPDPEKFVLDLGGAVKMEFVRIKAGKFTMGEPGFDDEIPHEVTLSRDYWLQTTETTQAQWEAVIGKNPSHFKGADLPVETVSWDDCQEFMKKLNEKLALRSSESEGGAKEQLKGKTAGLPTEAQWEYACRGGTTARWCFGDDAEQLVEYAWYGWNSEEKTHPVGRKKPNAWGLYDMCGNVREWCEDRYEKYPPEAVTDPAGPANGPHRCLRGGGWDVFDKNARSASRYMGSPARAYNDFGLRVALR